MKKNVLAGLLLLFAFSACDDEPIAVMDNVKSSVTKGTWRITYFWDTDKDETSNFTGYNFTFGASDLLTASNGTNTYTGSWSITSSGSSSSLSDLDFNILFTAPLDFAELSEDWEILETTATKLRLQHVSGGGGGTDLLTFEKN